MRNSNYDEIELIFNNKLIEKIHSLLLEEGKDITFIFFSKINMLYGNVKVTIKKVSIKEKVFKKILFLLRESNTSYYYKKVRTIDKEVFKEEGFYISEEDDLIAEDFLKNIRNAETD